MALINDVGLSGYGSLASGIPHDWTEGTNVIPSSGTITIGNSAKTGNTRTWLYVQNQGTAVITVNVSAQTAQGGTVLVPILLAGGSAAGQPGGSQEFGLGNLMPNTAFNVVGTAGQAVTVLEVLE